VRNAVSILILKIILLDFRFLDYVRVESMLVRSIHVQSNKVVLSHTSLLVSEGFISVAPPDSQVNWAKLFEEMMVPVDRATLVADGPVLRYKHKLQSVQLPPDVDHLKLFLQGEAKVKVPIRSPFYDMLLEEPLWQNHISSIAVADDVNFCPSLERLIICSSNQITGYQSIDSEVPMAKYIDDHMMIFLSLITGCNIFHNVTATSSQGYRPDLSLSNKGFAPIFVGEDKLRTNYKSGELGHDPELENVIKTPWNHWEDFYFQAPYILSYTAIGDNDSIDTTIGALDPLTRTFVKLNESPLNVLRNGLGSTELIVLCVKLFPVAIQLHNIIRQNPINYEIQDMKQLMEVNDVIVKKSLLIRNKVYFQKTWKFRNEAVATKFFDRMDRIFGTLQHHPCFVHLSTDFRFHLDKDLTVKAVFEPYGNRVVVSDLKELIYYFIQICEALKQLHSLGIVHNDIRWDNILTQKVDGQAKIFLIDFDDAFMLESPTSKCPPLAYLSIEEHAPNIFEAHGIEVDTFAVGKLLLEKLNDLQGGGNVPSEPFKAVNDLAQRIMKEFKTLEINSILQQLTTIRNTYRLGPP
jgi:hypothetical protein